MEYPDITTSTLTSDNHAHCDVIGGNSVTSFLHQNNAVYWSTVHTDTDSDDDDDDI